MKYFRYSIETPIDICLLHCIIIIVAIGLVISCNVFKIKVINMKNGKITMKLMVLLLVVLGWSLGAAASSAFIGNTGYDGIRQALDAAKPGDVIRLTPGRHQGPVVINKDRITLKGDAGAVITGAAQWKPEWRAEPEYGHAFSSPLSFEPRVMQCNDRFMINIVAGRAKDGLKKIHRDGVGRSGRNVLQSMFTYLKAEKRVIVSFASPVNIEDVRIEAAVAGSALTVSANDCVVEGIIVYGGTHGVTFENASRSIVRNCVMLSSENKVVFGKNSNSCKLYSCDITLNPDGMNFNARSGNDNPSWDVWVAHKSYGTYDKTGIFFEAAGSNNEAYSNYVYNVWNGIGSDNGVGPNGIVDFYKNSVFPQKTELNRSERVHHNRVDLCMDDGLEPGGDLYDCWWYGNMITRALCGIRIKGVGVGPFYLFDNVMRYCNDGMRFYKTTAPQAEAFIYHNYIEHEYAICYHSINQVPWNNPELDKLLPVKGSPGYHAYNNVFVSPEMLKPLPEGFVPNHQGDGNFYTSPRPEILPKSIDANSRFNGKFTPVNAKAGDFAAKPGTEFGGIDLSGRKLPLWRQAPAGLLKIEPELLPHGPVSGLWETAAGIFNIGERNPGEFTLVPLRLVAATELNYVVKANRDNVVIRLVRSPDGREAEDFKVVISDDNGKELAARQAVKATVLEEMIFKVDGRNGIKIKITDPAGKGRWTVSSPDKNVVIELLVRGHIRLQKSDGGPFVWEYDNRNRDEKSFYVNAKSGYKGDFKVSVTGPDGNEVTVPKSGWIETAGQKGIWTVKIYYSKKAHLYGPKEGSTPLRLALEQPTGEFTLMPKLTY